MANDMTVNRVAVTMPPAAEGIRGPIAIEVGVDNVSGAVRYANASARHYAYDAATRTLTVHLEEQAPVLPPGLVLLSDHPRTPAQVEVPAGGQATLSVRIPSVIRKPGANGAGWVEVPIGPVDFVDLRVQHSATPLPPVAPHETGTAYHARALRGSDTLSARVAAEPGRQPRRPYPTRP